MSTHYVYIPGLGNKNDLLRRFLIASWRLRKGVFSQLVPIRWDKNWSVATMIRHIKNAVEMVPPGDKVVLVGESAGGALAIVAGLTDVRITGIVTVCGKNIRPDTLGRRYTERYGSLQETVEVSERLLHEHATLAREKVVVFYSDHDPIIRKESTVLDGLRSNVFHSPGHIVSIAWIGLAHFGCIRRLFADVS